MKLPIFFITFALTLLHSYTLARAIDPEPIDIVPSDDRYAGLQGLLPSNIVSAVINLLLGSAGIASFIFLLWGGVQWIMSSGDKEGLEKARKKLSGALVGLALVFSAYAFIFIVQALFGIQVIELPLRPITTSGSGATAGICGCWNGGCAAPGTVGRGSDGQCYQCTNGGWSFVGGSCGAISCSSCP
jgi:hypothetical protein